MTKLVRTTLSNAKLWEYLLQSGLAESIEELEIKRTKPQVNLPVADDVVPSPELVSTEVRDSLEEDLSKDQIAEQQKGQEAFLRLLPRLTALRRFSWQDHPPFKGAEEEDIWAHLAKLPELRELDLVDEQVAEEATSLHDTLQPLQNSSVSSRELAIDRSGCNSDTSSPWARSYLSRRSICKPSDSVHNITQIQNAKTRSTR